MTQSGESLVPTESEATLPPGRKAAKKEVETSAGGVSNKKRLTTDEIEEQFEEAAGVKKLLENSNFVAVNLYSKSIFGEDILANVSIEQVKSADGRPQKITGSVRIRSRAQGIALSLGDRISVTQRGLH